MHSFICTYPRYFISLWYKILQKSATKKQYYGKYYGKT